MKKEYFYNSKNFEDVYTTYMYLNNCKKFYYINEVFYISDRDNPNSLTKDKTIKMKLDAFDIIEKLYNNTKFKQRMIKFRFYSYIENWKMIMKLFKITKEEKNFLDKLKEINKNIVRDMDFKKLSLKDKVRYYLTNIVVKIGRCTVLKKSSITKNYIYNVVYQIIVIILPIITTPYISRALGAEAVGIYGYVNSIVAYFTLVGTLGLTNYGKREIAYVQDNKEKRDKVFSELLLFRIIMTLITIVVYIITLCINNEYSVYYQILILEILAMIFDISWFFQGIEDFKKVVIRNVIVKLFSIVSIFIFVKKPEDLWIYFGIYALSTLLGNITLWIKIKKYVKLKKVKIKDLKKHIKPTISLFIPQVATSIYTILNKTMLGNIVENISEVGFYEQSQKIVKIALTVVTTIGIVMVPRIANTYASGDKNKISEYMKKTFNFIWILSIPIMFGIMATSKDLVPWFFGNGYEPVANLMIFSSPIIVFISISTVIGSQLLMSIKKQNVHTMAVIIGAIINIFLNIILLNRYKSMGAVISTTIAELAIAVIEIIYVILHKYLKLKEIFYKSYKYFIIGVIMFVCVWILQNNLSASITSTMIEVIVGIIIYFGLLLITKDEFLNQYIIKKLLIKLKSKKRMRCI